jgi:hypothetical protein
MTSPELPPTPEDESLEDLLKLNDQLRRQLERGQLVRRGAINRTLIKEKGNIEDVVERHEEVTQLVGGLDMPLDKKPGIGHISSRGTKRQGMAMDPKTAERTARILAAQEQQTLRRAEKKAAQEVPENTATPRDDRGR